MRRLVPLVLLCLIVALGWLVPPAGAQTPRARVVVLVVEPSTVEEWNAEPALARALSSGAAALLSARVPPGDDEIVSRADAYAVLGAGARTLDAPTRLADVLGENGAGLATTVDVLGGRRPAQAPATAGDIARLLERNDVLVLDAAPQLVDEARSALGSDDRLIVLSLPGEQRLEREILLGIVAVLGEGLPAGTATSPTTRRDGVVSLTDIAPTVLDAVDVPVPPAMSGRPIATRARADAPRVVRDLERDLVHVASIRGALVRMLAYGAAAGLGVVALALAFARPGERARRISGLLVVWVAALPLTLLAEPLLPRMDASSAASWTAGLALVVALLASIRLRAPSALGVVAAVTVVVVLADVAAGSPLASRAPISFLIARGHRFYGIGNELMGVVVGAALVAVGSALGSRRLQASARAFGPLVLAGAVAVMALPMLGAKLGATLTAVPAFGILAARAGGRRLTPRFAIGLGVVTVALTGAVYLADRLRAAPGRTHIGRVGEPGFWEALQRKVDAAIGIALFSFWVVALLVVVAAAILLVVRRRDEIRAAFGARPFLGPVMQSSLAGMVAAAVFNDAGLIATLMIAVYAVAALLAALLDPPAVDPPHLVALG